MFCHLYRLLDRTSLPLNEFEKCTDQCQYYDSAKTGHCKITEILNTNLTKEKYNWILESRIQFDPPRDSKSGNTRYISTIFLIHPAHNDICIVYYLKKGKLSDKWDSGFKLFFSSDIKEFPNLKTMNDYLKGNGFGGRRLMLYDFVKVEKTEEK
jgi:hypothetical protein